MAVSPGIRFGPYEILAPLAAGGMGEVYRARDTRLDREVAVKVLPVTYAADADRLRRFEQEARAAGRLNHPNILVLHDVGAHEGIPYLVMELLDGETLRSKMAGSALSPRKAIDFGLQIARGLAAAHEHGLVHRDLKPDNIFVLRDGRVKILDFGIAKLTRPEARTGTGARTTAQTAAVDTDPGVVMGTAGYMSPEQVRGLPADQRSDIFTFGAVLYEMLSGHRAFQGETSAETMTAILREDPLPLTAPGRSLPPALERIIGHCLEKSPQERFQSASDIAFALEALSGISDSGAKQAIAQPTKHVRAAFIQGIVAFVCLIAGLIVGRNVLAPRSKAPITYQELTFSRGYVHSAHFSGPGRVVYSASWSGSDPAVFASDIDVPGTQVPDAPPNTMLLSVSKSGELAVLLHPAGRPHGLGIGTLARMSGGSAPCEILDHVTDADFSPGGSSFAVVHVLGTRYRVEYPIGRVLYESPGWISHVRVSPDGKKVAFLEHPVFPDDRGSPMVVESNNPARTLTSDFSSTEGLAWSPSGREIWFGGATKGSASSIYAVDLGGHTRLVASLPGSSRILDIAEDGDALLTTDDISCGILCRPPGESAERDLTWLDWSVPAAFSRDGKRILFDEEGEGGGAHYSVCIRGTDGSPPIRLGEGSASDLSPDGRWAISIRFWENSPQIVLLPTGPGEPTTLPSTNLEQIWLASFLPSGDRLLVAGNERGHGTRGYVVPISGGTLRPISPEGVEFRPGAISPDGRGALGFVRGVGAMIYPIDGAPPRPIRGFLPDEVPLGWSADGTSIYVRRPGPQWNQVEIDQLDLTTGSLRLWARLDSRQGNAGLGIGTALIGWDDHSYAYLYGRGLSDLYLARGLR